MARMDINKVPEFKTRKYRKKVLILIIVYIITITGFNSDYLDLSNLSLPTFSSSEVVVLPEGTAKLTFIDVGQGDSSLIQTDKYDILIDAGESSYGDDVVKKLKELGVDDIEYLVATHPHSDHIGGIPEVLENFEVENFVMPNVAHTTKTYEKMLDLVSEKNINVIVPYQGQYLFDDNGAKLKVISPEVKNDDNLNNYSICLKFDFGNTRAIYTGDAEAKIEEIIINSGESLQCDVYQVGHHGSVTSNSQEFINALQPQISIISCAKNNDYGHPHKEIIDRLNAINSQIYITYELSDIEILTDGNNIEVNY